jgi:ABC transporter transmembrane region 2
MVPHPASSAVAASVVFSFEPRLAGRIWLAAHAVALVQRVKGNCQKIKRFGMERMDTVRKPPLSQPPDAPRLVLRSDSAIAQLMTLLRALIGSRRRRQLGLLALGVVVVICANAAGQIRLNIWQRDFYEAIEQRHVAAFIAQLMVFAAIAGALLVLVVSQTWLQSMVNVRLREWLTHDLLDQWLVRKRVYLLASRARSASIPISASSRTPST